jgi:hypothetical protein
LKGGVEIVGVLVMAQQNRVNVADLGDLRSSRKV